MAIDRVGNSFPRSPDKGKALPAAGRQVAADHEAQSDAAIAAAVLRRDPLGAADRDADGFRKLFESALQIGRGNRVAGAINDDISGLCRSLQFRKPSTQLGQLGRGGAQPGRQHAPVWECRRIFREQPQPMRRAA
jgi:hypothetical protein